MSRATMNYPRNAQPTSTSATPIAIATNQISLLRATCLRVGLKPMVQYRLAGAISCALLVASVAVMRRTLLSFAFVACFVGFGAPAVVQGAPSATTIPPTTLVGATTTTSSTTTSSTTTTTLPSAVTTVPEGCALPPVAQAVFVGVITKRDAVSATFKVSQVRAGSLEGYLTNDSTEVRYGADAKYLDKGKAYIVGVALDSVTLKLSSTIRDAAEIFGGAEVVGSTKQCPKFDAAARTLHIDGTSISSGLFDKFFDQPLRLVIVLVLPTLLVVMMLVGLVWFRRGIRR